jgi:hypothetical protein
MSPKKGMRQLRPIAPALLLSLCSVTTAQTDAGGWRTADPMKHARDTFTLTALPDGNVLASGGASGHGWLASSEIFDVKSGTWRPTGDLNQPRYGHTATVLQDGRVLVTGSWIDRYIASTETYDPATGLWKTSAPMHHPRDRHTATLLPDGRVLVAGGFSDGGALASVEVYDPAADTWTEWPDLPRPTAYHIAAVLDPETILFGGGEGQRRNYPHAMLFEWKSQTFQATPDLSVPHAYGETATLLRDGNVLVGGGEPNEPGAGKTALKSVEMFDVATKRWSERASLNIPRFFHTSTLLRDGRVLVTGGMTRAEPNPAQSSTEFYDAAEDSWTSGPRMSSGRARHCAVILPDGSVLVAGGHGPDGDPLNSVEILRP